MAEMAIRETGRFEGAFGSYVTTGWCCYLLPWKNAAMEDRRSDKCWVDNTVFLNLNATVCAQEERGIRCENVCHSHWKLALMYSDSR